MSSSLESYPPPAPEYEDTGLVAIVGGEVIPLKGLDTTYGVMGALHRIAKEKGLELPADSIIRTIHEDDLPGEVH
jgi:hypothetical protein